MSNNQPGITKPERMDIHSTSRPTFFVPFAQTFAVSTCRVVPLTLYPTDRPIGHSGSSFELYNRRHSIQSLHARFSVFFKRLTGNGGCSPQRGDSKYVCMRVSVYINTTRQEHNSTPYFPPSLPLSPNTYFLTHSLLHNTMTSVTVSTSRPSNVRSGFVYGLSDANWFGFVREGVLSISLPTVHTVSLPGPQLSHRVVNTRNAFPRCGARPGRAGLTSDAQGLCESLQAHAPSPPLTIGL